MHKKTPGFTLIELMITVVIFSILSMIAYPAYKNYLMKSRRADAMATIATNQMALERCYAQNFSYAAACSGLPSFPQTSAQSYYSITLSNLGVSTYTITATPIGIQAQDTTCASMSVDQTNTKTAVNSSGTAQTSCWNPT